MKEAPIWDAGATPEAVYRDQIQAGCGEACLTEMQAVFREVEAVTLSLEQHGPGLTFPVPGMIMKHWAPGEMPPELIEARRGYQLALDAARRAWAKTGSTGEAYIEYWVGRLEFAAGYLDTIEAVRRAATADADGRTADARQHTEAALSAAHRALAAYAHVARDQSDRGVIAVVNEYVYRPLKAKLGEWPG